MKNTRRRSQFGRGSAGAIDLTFGGKHWSINRSKIFDEKHDRLIFDQGQEATIQLPMIGVDSPDVFDDMYQLRVKGPIMMGGLLKIISSIYKEHSNGSIKEVAGGLVNINRLNPIGPNTYDLILVA